MIQRFTLTFLSLLSLGPLLASKVEVLLTTIDTNEARLAKSSLLLDEKEEGKGQLIAIDSSQAFQSMLGYGAALTDSSATLLMSLRSHDEAQYWEVIEKLFSTEKGAGFRMLRLPMGASDYVATKNYWTYCDRPSANLEGFSIARDQVAIVPILKDILKIAPDLRIIATPWSAPAWMKENGKLGGVSLQEKEEGISARLKRDSFAVYGTYFVKFLQSYRSEGIEIFGVTLQNEPQNDQSAYPCMRMDVEDQIRFVKTLAPQIKAAGLKTQIFVHDHNWIVHANDQKVVNGDKKEEPLAIVSKVFSDPSVRELVAGTAWHCYAGDPVEMEKVYRTLRERYPRKMILTTEASAWGKDRGDWWGDIEWGMAHVWLRPQLEGSVAALQWNLLLDQNSGPSPRTDSEAYGLVTLDTEKKALTYEREFFAMAQLSRAALPGSQRIGCTSSGGLDTIAFLLPDKGISLVVFNRNGDGRSFRVVEGKRGFDYKIPGHSIATFVW